MRLFPKFHSTPFALETSLAAMGALLIFKASALAVSNGFLISNSLVPGVAQLTNRGSCTSTFLNPTTVITAAHCVTRTEKGCHAKIGAHESRDCYIPNEYHEILSAPGDEKAKENKARPWDLAILVFDQKVSQEHKLSDDLYFDVSENRPRVGDRIYVFGYGAVSREIHHSPPGGGHGYEVARGLGDESAAQRKTLRHGTNKIAYMDESFIHATGYSYGIGRSSSGTGEEISLTPGDSGGPLLNASHELVGVASAARALPELTENHDATWVDLNSKNSQALFRAAILCDAGRICAKNFKGSGVRPSEDHPVMNRSKLLRPAPFIDLGLAFRVPRSWIRTATSPAILRKTPGLEESTVIPFATGAGDLQFLIKAKPKAQGSRLNQPGKTGLDTLDGIAFLDPVPGFELELKPDRGNRSPDDEVYTIQELIEATAQAVE